MLQLIFIFLGVMAGVASTLAFSNRLHVDAKIVAATASFLLWILWGLSAYSVEVITDNGTRVNNSYEALVMLGLAAAGVMLAYIVWNVMEMFGMSPKRLLGVRL